MCTTGGTTCTTLSPCSPGPIAPLLHAALLIPARSVAMLDITLE